MRQLTKGRYKELCGNENTQNELCPGNPGFLVVTNKIRDKVHREMSPEDLDDPGEEVSVG